MTRRPFYSYSQYNYNDKVYLGAHHGHLGSGPGVVGVTAQVLRAHHVIGAAISLARDDGDLGHGGLGIGIEQLGTVGDDAIVLLGGAGQEAGHVDQGDQGNVEGITKTDETPGLD